MTPEDRKTIEEALERAKSILDTTDGVLNEGMIIKVDGAFHRNIRSAVAESDRALALLRAEPEAREPDESVHIHTVYEARGGGYICSGCDMRFVEAREPKVMTDEEIERLASSSRRGRERTVGSG